MPATSSVFLNVNDIEKSLSFYQGLGFRVAKRYKTEEGAIGWADLTLQGADLGLGAIRTNDDPEFQSWVSTPLGAGVIVYFTVPRVDTFWKKAQDSGATIEQPITDRPYGRMFTVNDPDGYTITFITEPKATRRPAKTAGKKPGKTAGKKAAKKAAKKAKAPATKGAKKAAKKAPAKTAKKAARKASTKRAKKSARKARRG